MQDNVITESEVDSFMYRMFPKVDAELKERGFRTYKTVPIKTNGNVLAQYTKHHNGVRYHVNLIHSWTPSVGGIAKAGPIVSANLEISSVDVV